MASMDRTAKVRIVCLHGFSCNSAIYRFQTARLRKRWAEHLRQHPLVAAASSSSSSPSGTSSSSRATSPGLDDPWQRNNTQYYYDSDEESSSAATTTSSSSVDLLASSSSSSSSSRTSISFSSDYHQPSYSSGSTNGGNGGGSGIVVYNDVEFIFLESPREVSAPEQPLAEVASLFPGPYRTWFEPSTTTTTSTETGGRAAKTDDGRRARRRRDPAVERWVVEQVKRAGGVHGVLAFSDGAALTAALTLKAEAGVAACPKLWDFVVLACGVDPYPDPWLHGSGSSNGGIADGEEAKEEDQDEEGQAGKRCLARLKTPGLHIVGLRDEVYRDRSEALWGLVHPQAVAAAAAAADRDEKGRSAASGMAAEIYRFDDGHKVPVQDTDLDAILSAWRRVVVRSGLFRDASPDEVVAASRVLAV